jgi:hypothetical protein
MIGEAKEEHPRMPLSDPCELFGVSRSWYYKKPSPHEKAGQDVVRPRDAIERIVLEFPGYGYRRVTQTLKRQGWTNQPQESAAGDEKRVASVPTQTRLQADHRLLALSEDLPEPHQGYGGGCS